VRTTLVSTDSPAEGRGFELPVPPTTHLGRVSHWDLDDFRAWAERALVTVRELRRSFVEPGDLVWRAQAADALVSTRADAPGLAGWLAKRPARHHLRAMP